MTGTWWRYENARLEIELQKQGERKLRIPSVNSQIPVTHPRTKKEHLISLNNQNLFALLAIIAGLHSCGSSFNNNFYCTNNTFNDCFDHMMVEVNIVFLLKLTSVKMFSHHKCINENNWLIKTDIKYCNK